MSDLRTRIASVLVRDAFGLTSQTAALRQADAVIRELKLEALGTDTHCVRTSVNG